MELFEIACANPENTHAQDLLNVFGADGAVHILRTMPLVPLGVFVDVVRHIWLALTFEALRMGDNFQWVIEDDGIAPPGSPGRGA
jgi:hypothetical protein